MKKILRCFLMLTVFALLLSTVAFADDSAAKLGYVTDDAGILSDQQEQELSSAAAKVSSEYGCSVYIITLDDYTRYTYGSVYDCATEIFEKYELGWGSDKNGVLLLMSMNDRDYSLIGHGSTATTAFTDYAQEILENEFLDDFRNNDWYGGFADYIETAAYLLSESKQGHPVDIQESYGGSYDNSGYYNGGSYNSVPGTGDHMTNLMIIVLVPCLIALAVCSAFKAQMKTARIKTNANEYVAQGGVNLRVRQDLFTHRTQTRQIIQQPNQNRGGMGHSGGTTIRSGGFTGRSGKF